jgi:hypothetical protein
MNYLTISDIKEWLIENRNIYQELQAQEFPPFDNPVYSMYFQLRDFIEYYKYKNKCDKALLKLKANLNSNFAALSKWTKDYEILGSQDLLMFEVNYIEWDEDVNEDKIKINVGLFTYRKPFANILCFCKVFQHLYWDNGINTIEPTEREKIKIKTQLQNILNEYYLDIA